jgi:hypothetical protein
MIMALILVFINSKTGSCRYKADDKNLQFGIVQIKIPFLR